MMLDKDQIEGWEGEPEPADAKAKAAGKPVASATPPASAVQAAQSAMSVEPAPVVHAAPPEAAETRGGLAGAIFDSREAVPTGETVKITPAQERIRKRRAQWTALALFGFVILIFLITIAKLGANVLVRDL